MNMRRKITQGLIPLAPALPARSSQGEGGGILARCFAPLKRGVATWTIRESPLRGESQRRGRREIRMLATQPDPMAATIKILNNVWPD